MPLTFIFLGVILIYQIFYEGNKTKKVVFFVLTFFALLGFIVSPLFLNKMSINVNLLISSIGLLIFYIKDFPILTNLNLIFQSLVIVLIYFVIAKYSSDFITTLNPYPILSVILVFNLLNLKNINFVVGLNCLTFLFINFINVSVESGLGYVHLINAELFNFIGVITIFIAMLNLCFYKLNVLKGVNK